MSAIRHGARVDVPPGRPGGVIGGAEWEAEDGAARSVTIYARPEWSEGRRWEAGPGSPLGLVLGFGGPSAGLTLRELVPAVGCAVHLVAAQVEAQVARLEATALPYRVALSLAPGQPVRTVRTVLRAEGAPAPLPPFTVRVRDAAGVRFLDPDGAPLPELGEAPPGAHAIAPGPPRAIACEVLR